MTSNILLDKSKIIKYDLQNAKSQVNVLMNLLDSSFVVNDNYYIQKDELILLDNKISKMIDIVNNNILTSFNNN
jgi:hypothetical protein